MIWLITWITAFFFIFQLVNTYDGTDYAPLMVLVLIVLLLRWLIYRFIRKRILMRKYKDKEVVRNIIRRKIWMGASTEMIKDSWGRPGDIKSGSHKTVWCYGNIGKNRWKHRITFNRDDVVSSWTEN